MWVQPSGNSRTRVQIHKSKPVAPRNVWQQRIAAERRELLQSRQQENQ